MHICISSYMKNERQHTKYLNAKNTVIRAIFVGLSANSYALRVFCPKRTIIHQGVLFNGQRGISSHFAGKREIYIKVLLEEVQNSCVTLPQLSFRKHDVTTKQS